MSNNIFEYLAEVVCMYLGILEGEVLPDSCVLSGIDSASAISWTHKSSFSDYVQEPHIFMSRRLALLTIEHRFCLYSQYLARFKNIVVDSLSRDLYLDNLFLTHLLMYFYPFQLFSSFHISPLPPNIFFVTGTFEALLVPPQGS